MGRRHANPASVQRRARDTSFDGPSLGRDTPIVPVGRCRIGAGSIDRAFAAGISTELVLAASRIASFANQSDCRESSARVLQPFDRAMVGRHVTRTGDDPWPRARLGQGLPDSILGGCHLPALWSLAEGGTSSESGCTHVWYIAGVTVVERASRSSGLAVPTLSACADAPLERAERADSARQHVAGFVVGRSRGRRVAVNRHLCPARIRRLPSDDHCYGNLRSYEGLFQRCPKQESPQLRGFGGVHFPLHTSA